MKKALLLLAAALTIGMAANAQTVFSENFNGLTDGTVPTNWVTYGDSQVNHYSGFSQSWSAYQNTMICITWTDVATPCDRWLVTPQINIPATNPTLLFDIYGVSYGPGSQYAESLKIMVSTTDNQKASFTVLEDLGNLLAGDNTYAVDLSNYAGQQVYLAFYCYTSDGMYIFLDNVEVTSLPNNGIALSKVTSTKWVPRNGTISVNVTVKNVGADPLTMFDIAYDVDGMNPSTVSVNGINVPSFGYYTHTFTTSYNEIGKFDINVAVSNPNGDVDMDQNDNNGSTYVNVYVPEDATPRTTVLEHFTTAQCGNCPSGHQRLEAAIQGREDRVVWIAHHVGYYTDNMTISQSEQMLAFFNDGGSTYAPASMLDRSRDNATEDDPGPVFFPGSDVSAVITGALERPSFTTIEFSNIDYEPQSRLLTVTVSGTFTGDLSMDSPRLSVYIMEDSIMAAQSGATGLYQHNHVIRDCITDVWGDATAITSTTKNSTFSKTYTYVLDPKLRAHKSWIAAFVSNYATDVNNREIINGCKSARLMNTLDPTTTTGISGVEASINIKTYPNPATEMAYISAENTIRGYKVVNTLGQEVMAQENVNADVLELNVSTLAAGLYFISVSTDNGVATERLNVVR